MRVAVASGKGGTGKTFVSVNLFRTFRQLGYHSSLVDCDTETPNTLAFLPKTPAGEKTVMEYRPKIDAEKCLFCGRCADYCEYNAIIVVPESRYIRLLSDLCHGCSACSVACTSGAITDSETTVGQVCSFNYEKELCLMEGRMRPGHASSVPLIKAVTNVAFAQTFDYTFYDSPPGTSCPFIQTVVKADYVILVTEPTPFGLSDLRQAIETLQTMDKPFGIIINRAGLGDRGVYDYIASNDFELLTEIPFNEQIARIYSEGGVVVDHHPESKELFTALANKLTALWK